MSEKGSFSDTKRHWEVKRSLNAIRVWMTVTGEGGISTIQEASYLAFSNRSCVFPRVNCRDMIVKKNSCWMVAEILGRALHDGSVCRIGILIPNHGYF